MAVRTTDELLASLRTHLGDDTTDEALSLIEDVSDTLGSLSGGPDAAEWQRRYNENDASWRKKYRDRFFGANNDNDNDDDNDDNNDKPKTFNDLFKEG